MAKKRGSKKAKAVKNPAPVARKSSGKPTGPGRFIISLVTLILIVAFISLAASLLQRDLPPPSGVTLTPYVSEYIEASKEYLPKLKLSDAAFEVTAGQMAEIIMFVGNNNEMSKDVTLDVMCEARTAQGCAYVDLKYEHLVLVPADTVEAFPLEITTTDNVKPGVYDITVEASMDGKKYASAIFLLEVKSLEEI
ncbi:hypothetical protein KY335_05010 [Candidatus Woesearchaeota archaeon]|nr:hypothetical protein [Candidatus Woesearchaeota archaeon]MBW3014569.1 hypothetical protein [Candidatus Woesearchaeota archaeon]